MCSIVLRIGADGVFIGANRDEMVERAWDAPGEFWPGVIAGRDRLAGGTWLGMNRHGVVAAVLNLDVRATQEGAISLYEASGFTRWGTHPAYARVKGATVAGHFYYKTLTK